MENWKGQVAHIEIFKPKEIFIKEPQLLALAKKTLVKLPTDELDVLIIDEIGKNISGTGSQNYP